MSSRKNCAQMLMMISFFIFRARPSDSGDCIAWKHLSKETFSSKLGELNTFFSQKRMTRTSPQCLWMPPFFVWKKYDISVQIMPRPIKRRLGILQNGGDCFRESQPKCRKTSGLGISNFTRSLPRSLGKLEEMLVMYRNVEKPGECY